jgi:biotin-dependent carboxylase-like uncharacterized protein
VSLTIEVLRAGALTTIQDLGRPGWAHLGVPRSGAADPDSLRLANRLVGNREDAPALETTLVGPRLRIDGPTLLAITGAPVRPRVGDEVLEMNTPLELDGGDELVLGSASSGLRSYIAIRGAIDAARVLGSASSDLLTGLGPAPLKDGDRLRVGPAPATPPAGQPAPVRALEPEPWLGLTLGPRADWFTAQARRTLLGASYAVSATSNRVGVRLEGPRLAYADSRDLASEGMRPGALQVPPSGLPIMLLSDHPTTGGYPVIAVLDSDQLSLAGQLRPGQTVRFRVREGRTQ